MKETYIGTQFTINALVVTHQTYGTQQATNVLDARYRFQNTPSMNILVAI